jgi:hypothetical protein
VTTTTVNTDKLAEAMADATAQLKLWTDRRAQLAEQLLAAHAAGDVPTKFEAAGCTFQLQQGRKTVIYPPSVEAEVKMIQSIAQEAGLCSEKQGVAFWRVTFTKKSD